MKPLIYIVEDDGALQELYEYSLDGEFESKIFDHGGEFFAALEDAKPDLVILDVMLPGEFDGFSILEKLKKDKNTAHVPVIMISAKGDETSKVRGLNMGADDYVAKPFGVMEFVARVKANLRRNLKASATENVIYKDIRVDLLKHVISVAKTPIKTTLKEYNLLCMLCENAEKVQKRDDIFLEVWGDGFLGETRTLDIHIKELRKKLAEAESEAVIQTVRGVGYMLV
ncbi:MAG: response regulator transcription factor [Oscillospiraceae bacterium]|nr:response regulator transcription factor [Oscillospiraceae bacterium]